MKRLLKLFGLVLIITLTAASCQNSGRRFEGRFDHSRMRRHENAMDFRNMRNMNHIGYGRNFQMRPGWMMARGQGNMGAGFNRQGTMRFSNIPGLTDQQRKQLADLRLKHMQEMDKLREETFAKFQDLRASDRKEMMGILTPEQQKYLESGTARSESGSSTTEK